MIKHTKGEAENPKQRQTNNYIEINTIQPAKGFWAKKQGMTLNKIQTQHNINDLRTIKCHIKK